MILVVDDEAEITNYILEYLICHNIEAQGTCSPEEALSLASKTKYSCIITDIAMPGMNGIELSKKLRAENPHLKIICLSGFVDMMRDDLNDMKIDYLLQKPFRPRELVNCVKLCLEAP